MGICIWIRAACVAGVAGLAACASVPPESVELSKKIGAEIGKSREAHLSTLDAFYRRLKEDNDAWVASTFLPRSIHNAQAGLAAACKQANDTSDTCSRLGPSDFARIYQNTIGFRDDTQRALEKNRDEAVRLVTGHYADLIAANAAITGLLSSAVDLRKATRDAAKTVGDIAGVEIDTEAIEKAFGDHLKSAGAAGQKVADLEKKLSDALDKLRKK